jgi:hypothetical protein
MITQMKGHGEKFTRRKDAAIIGLRHRRCRLAQVGLSRAVAVLISVRRRNYFRLHFLILAALFTLKTGFIRDALPDFIYEGQMRHKDLYRKTNQ